MKSKLEKASIIQTTGQISHQLKNLKMHIQGEVLLDLKAVETGQSHHVSGEKRKF